MQTMIWWVGAIHIIAYATLGTVAVVTALAFWVIDQTTARSALLAFAFDRAKRGLWPYPKREPRHD